MSRKAKYSFEIKLQTVLNLIDGKESIQAAANRLNMNSTSIRKWVAKYESGGEPALKSNNKNKSYSVELKQSAVSEYLEGNGSLRDIIATYNISSESILLSWINKYNNHIETKAYNIYESKGVYMRDNKKYTIEQKIEIAKNCFNNNCDYSSIASKYNTSYTNVYNWTKKYIKYGEDGLQDNRGRKKVDEELSEVELLKRKVSRLERENELKQQEIKILKKLEEKERSVLLLRQKMK